MCPSIRLKGERRGRERGRRKGNTDAKFKE
jgi:hypothetical protein